MTYEEYKIKEFKGDALALFIACILICTDPLRRSEQRDRVYAIISNYNFSDISKKLGLKPHPEDGFEHPIKIGKRYANAYEVKLFEIYEKDGFMMALRFFNDTAINNYLKKPLINKFE